jgi:hypothetical protein
MQHEIFETHCRYPIRVRGSLGHKHGSTGQAEMRAEPQHAKINPAFSYHPPSLTNDIIPIYNSA